MRSKPLLPLRSLSLAGRGVLVTGASRGLGLALSQRLAAAGARVVMLARGAAALDQAVASVHAQGGEAHGLVADVGAPGEATRIAALATEWVGPISVLVHNASTLGGVPLPLLLDMAPAAIQHTFEVNVLGPLRLTRALAGGMALYGGGVVVHLSSDAAVEAYPQWGAYGASKAAQDHIMRTLAAELAHTGVRLFSVDPGEMDTQMHRDALPDADPSTLARPVGVADRILAMVQDPIGAPSGARLAASRWTPEGPGVAT